MTYTRPIINSGNGGSNYRISADVAWSTPGVAVPLPFPEVTRWVNGVESDVSEVSPRDGS